MAQTYFQIIQKKKNQNFIDAKIAALKSLEIKSK